MTRLFAVTAGLAFAAAVALIVTTTAIPLAIVLLLLSAAISAALAVRRGVQAARSVLRSASKFISGDVQRARIADVSDPKGIFFTKSIARFELEGEDGTVHSFEREIHVPFLWAWSYRLGKRVKLPFVGSIDLGEAMAVELRREGIQVSVGRAPRPTGAATPAAANLNPLSGSARAPAPGPPPPAARAAA